MEVACVVMDLGSGSIKAEFAGAENPKVFQNVIGEVKHKAAIPQQSLEGLIDSNYFVSNDVSKHRGVLKLSYPMQNGHVNDWDAMTRVLHHVDGALGSDPKDHSILVSEAALTSRTQRATLGQILFEQLQHPSILFSVQALMSLYSTGNTTGVVLDVGDGVTHACPVYHGYTIREAVRRVDFGGRDITAYLQQLLRQYGTFLDTSAEFDIVREIKEQTCTVASSAINLQDAALGGGSGQVKSVSSSPSTLSVQKVRHRLPDGTQIIVGNEQCIAPEALFNPALIGKEVPSVVQVLSESIRRSDIDLRRELYENIFLAGGSTLFANFPTRFLTEITKKTPRDCKVRLTAPAERLYTTWIGGSFLAQLSTFKSMAIKRSEFLEEGERVLHNKLFF